MIQYHFNHGPNPAKVSLFLEEAGLLWKPMPVDIRRGAQHTDAYRALNPNAKVPALVDGEVTVFDSNAILLYLAEKTGKFLPANTPVLRGELLSWLMFIASGVGPYSGQSIHFRTAAPDFPYARERYVFEARRHYAILDERLSSREYLVGGVYSITDISVWGWARLIPKVIGDDAWREFPHLRRLVDWISARDAAKRVEALRVQYTFTAELDDEARRHLFRHRNAATPAAAA